MSVTDEIAKVPTLEDLRGQLESLKDEIRNLTPASLAKVIDSVEERPAFLAIGALGVGLVIGYFLNRSH